VNSIEPPALQQRVGFPEGNGRICPEHIGQYGPIHKVRRPLDLIGAPALARENKLKDAIGKAHIGQSRRRGLDAVDDGSPPIDRCRPVRHSAALVHQQGPLRMAWRIRRGVDHQEHGFLESLLEQIVDGVGRRGTHGEIGVVIIGAKFDRMFVNEVLDLWLQDHLRHKINTAVHHRQNVRSAFPQAIPFPNVGDRQTDGVITRASGGIKEFEEDNAACEIAELQRCARGEHASARIGPRTSDIKSEVRDRIPHFVIGLNLG
jgi:hypothetical protein